VVLIVQSALLLLTALLFGLRIDPVGTLIVAVLMMLIGITMASLSYAIALLVKDEGTLAAVTNFFHAASRHIVRRHAAGGVCAGEYSRRRKIRSFQLCSRCGQSPVERHA